MTNHPVRNSEEAHVVRRTAKQWSNSEYHPQVPLAGATIASAARVLSGRAIGEHVNAPARTAALQIMQKTYGNRAVQRYLGAGTGSSPQKRGAITEAQYTQIPIQRYIRPGDMCEEEYRPERTQAAPAPPRSNGAPAPTPDSLIAQGWMPIEGTENEYIDPMSGERMKGPSHAKPKQADTPATAKSLESEGWIPMEGTENEYIHPLSGERKKGPKHGYSGSAKPGGDAKSAAPDQSGDFVGDAAKRIWEWL